MDASALTAHGAVRTGAFYLTALTYGQFLWQQGQVARAMLKLNRGLGADLRGDEPELQLWPLPYAAMGWFLQHAPADVFIGNPRVHFQHLADRMNEPRRDQRRWRAWACWQLARIVRPEFSGDPTHAVLEPTRDEIFSALRQHGHPLEAERWINVVTNSTARAERRP
jgi:hypothetical protein